MERGRRLPEWLKMQRASGGNYSRVKRLVETNNLHTICTSGNCPNIGECWYSGTATFMILGDICTRACRFCATKTGRPLPPDPDEPARLAEAIRMLDLSHCVITSVDRDDLPGGGAAFWAETIRKVKEVNKNTTIEALIPDFDGRSENLIRIVEAGADVISHNIETVRRLTPLIRTKAKYDRSLSVISFIAGKMKKAKSGFMVGIGESEAEVAETIKDLKENGCTIITIGQYLKPSPGHMDPVEFISPVRFRKYEKIALDTGFEHVECNPLVRSSFHAERHAC